MSPGRCSRCHCYSRNCPAGLPNHKGISPVGPSCPMNSLGRHFRDQKDIDTPTCDFEFNGVKCTFFEADNEFASLPYPVDDISTGPMSDTVHHDTSHVPPPATQGGDLAAILALLELQKVESEKTRAEIRHIQSQVNNLMSKDNPVPTTPSIVHHTPQPTVTVAADKTTTIPNVVASAAAGLAADLQGGLGHNNLGFNGLTMDMLRSNPAIVTRANDALNVATHNVPALNPLAGMGAALGTLRQDQGVSSVSDLYAATTVCKQLRAFEFASTGQFPYKSQLKQDNTNAITFAYGAIKHLEAVKSGLIKNMPDSEFLARLKHLRNVFEIACLSSPLTSFCDPSWQIAREYDSRLISDIESGNKSWDTLSNGLELDSIYCAKESIELKNRNKKQPTKGGADKKVPDDNIKAKKDPKKSGCTTYNTHRASDGCYFEHNNEGKSCVYDHYCSWCKLNRDVTEKHKALNCQFKPE